MLYQDPNTFLRTAINQNGWPGHTACPRPWSAAPAITSTFTSDEPLKIQALHQKMEINLLERKVLRLRTWSKGYPGALGKSDIP